MLVVLRSAVAPGVARYWAHGSSGAIMGPVGGGPVLMAAGANVCIGGGERVPITAGVGTAIAGSVPALTARGEGGGIDGGTPVPTVGGMGVGIPVEVATGWGTAAIGTGTAGVAAAATNPMNGAPPAIEEDDDW